MTFSYSEPSIATVALEEAIRKVEAAREEALRSTTMSLCKDVLFDAITELGSQFETTTMGSRSRMGTMMTSQNKNQTSRFTQNSQLMEYPSPSVNDSEMNSNY